MGHFAGRGAWAQLLDCGNNAPKLAGDGFRDYSELWISDLLHGYGGVDGSDFDLSASEVLHDHIAREHRSDLIIDRQRLVRQWRITGTENSIITEIEIELFFIVALTSISVSTPKPSALSASMTRLTTAEKSPLTVLAI